MSSARDRGSKRQSNSRRSSRRKDRQKKHHLTQEDIEYLKKNTRYDESEIREWYKGFKVILVVKMKQLTNFFEKTSFM